MPQSVTPPFLSATGDIEDAPRLPDLARRFVTVSMRINAAHTVVRKARVSARRNKFLEITSCQYAELRKVLVQLINNKIGKIDGAHHALGGGDGYNPEYDEHIENIATDCSLSDFSIISGLPNFTWKDIKFNSELFWDAPPVRALAMVDGTAGDLTAAFMLFERHINNISMGIAEVRLPISSTITMSSDGRAPIRRFEHDYLWFNNVALFDALEKLYTGFYGELIKSKYDNKKNKAKWIINVHEHVDNGQQCDKFIGLQIEIQQIMDQSVFEDVQPSTNRAVYVNVLIPPFARESNLIYHYPSDPDDKFNRLVKGVTIAGAHLYAHKGSIQILIPARNLAIEYDRMFKDKIWGVHSVAPSVAVLESLRGTIHSNQARANSAALFLPEQAGGGALNPPALVATESYKRIEIGDHIVIGVCDMSQHWEEQIHTVTTADRSDRKLLIKNGFDDDAIFWLLHVKPDAKDLDEIKRIVKNSNKPVIEITGGMNSKCPDLGLPLLTNCSNISKLLSMYWDRINLNYEGEVLDFVRKLRVRNG